MVLRNFAEVNKGPIKVCRSEILLNMWQGRPKVRALQLGDREHSYIDVVVRLGSVGLGFVKFCKGSFFFFIVLICLCPVLDEFNLIKRLSTVLSSAINGLPRVLSHI